MGRSVTPDTYPIQKAVSELRLGIMSPPTAGMLGTLMTQRMLTSPQPPDVRVDFWKLAYDAIG
jgi:hypothetical protein